MTYLLIKSAHIVSLFVGIAGMTVAALSLKVPAEPFVRHVRTYNRGVTAPAMILAWCFGLYLATQGGWLMQPWLAAKFALVIVLSGLHGILTRKLRRASDSGKEHQASRSHSLLAGLVLIIVIVVLVTLKP